VAARTARDHRAENRRNSGVIRWPSSYPEQSISRIHGQARRFGDVLVVPMYHPAAALHQGSLRRVIEEDFKKLPAFLREATRERPVETAPAAEQMKLL
jgi:DNA polymerase